MKLIKSIYFFATLIMVACTNGGSKQGEEQKDSIVISKQKQEPKVLTAEDIYKNTASKVAMILSYKDGIPYSQGSGFFIDKNTLVTNFHCVAGADKIEFKITGDDEIYKGAKVVKASDDYDLAIIKTRQDFPFVKIDSLEKEAVGSKVYAIGNPRGLEGTISDGILSGKRDNEGIEYLQITAPISPGNSGGPVLNEKGEVIGVATFTFRNSQSLNFAMPIKYIKGCIDVSRVKPIESTKIGNNNNAATMTSYIKNEFEDEAFFTIKNNTKDAISHIHYILIYKTLNGEIIDYNENVLREEIAPHLAKRFYDKGFGGWRDYSCNGESFCLAHHIYFKTEFRLISYEIEE